MVANTKNMDKEKTLIIGFDQFEVSDSQLFIYVNAYILALYGYLPFRW